MQTKRSIRFMPNVYVIIPAFNEAGAIGKVVRAVPRGLVSEIIVCDNKSTDATAQCAREAGATVVYAPEPGYGSACLCGIAYLKSRGPSDQPDIVVFLDGDYSDYPEEMLQLTAPIIEGSADLVIGSRALGKALKGALQPQQRFGNWLATSPDLGLSLYRSRSFPGHFLDAVDCSGYGRPQLRMDRGNAGESGFQTNTLHRGAGQLSPQDRQIQGLRHAQGLCLGRA
jgi:glycosyltransferase involved in cell wall biosynthesis